MSQENVETVREQYRLWTDNDIAGMLERWDSEGVVQTAPQFPEGGTFTDRSSIESFFRGMRQGWLNPTASAWDYREFPDAVLAQSEWRGVGQASGIEVDSQWWVLVTFKGDKIIGMRFFFDKAEALEAVGLSE